MPETSTRPDSRFASGIHDDVESLVWIYEQMGFLTDRSVSPSIIRDALEKAATGIEGSDRLEWRTWLDRSFQRLGLRCQSIEGTIDEICEMVNDGVQILARCDDGSWLAARQVKRGQILVARSDHEMATSRQSPRSFRATLERAHSEGTLRCIAAAPNITIPAADAAKHMKPVQRLWSLLKPEWTDIWVVIVFALVIGILALATPIAVETLVNTVAFGRFLQPLVILSLMLLVFLSFSAALRALQTHVVEIIQRRLFVRVAADIAYRLPRVRTELLGGQSGRELVNRFFDVVTVQKVAAQLLLDGVSLVLGTVIGMAMLAFYHPWLLGFDVLLLAMLAIIVFVLGRGAVKSSIKESKTKYHMAAWLEDLAGCPTAFRYDGSARFAIERTDQLTFDYLEARSNHFRILMRQIVFALGMQALASTILLGLGGWLVISGQLTLGQLVAAELIVAVIVGSFAKLGKHMESFYDVLASVDKLGSLFDLPLEPQDGLVALPDDSADEIEIRNVSCKSADAIEVLRNFNLTIKAGDRIAVTGPSGSGKSTLINLLFGMKTPDSGRVTLQGAEVREMHPESWRQFVAMVRDVEIFEGSITDNVRVGRPHVSAAHVRKSLEDVGLLDDLLRLPEQLGTSLRSTGHPLSSTQQRRLMVARACVGAPELLLIDRTLDVLPDREAIGLTTWLCRPEHPWKLVLVTGREDLANICNRQLELTRTTTGKVTTPKSSGNGQHD